MHVKLPTQPARAAAMMLVASSSSTKDVNNIELWFDSLMTQDIAVTAATKFLTIGEVVHHKVFWKLLAAATAMS